MTPRKKSILIYRIGSLGDTLVALPALWAVREHFRGSRLTLLCDHHPRKNYILAQGLLVGSGVVDDFVLYPVDNTPRGRLRRPFWMIKLLWALRRRGFDTLVYLAPSARTPAQVTRDRRFFRAAGIKQFIGMHDIVDPLKMPGPSLSPMPKEADMLLARLAGSGIAIPQPHMARFDLGIGPAENEEVNRWLQRLNSDGQRPWMGIGPGGKQPVNIWPLARYGDVVTRLIDRFDIWPVIFGGPEDRAVGSQLLAQWGRGYNAAGELGLRATACAMSRCRLHVGNDTGTIHLAAAAQIPCVGIYSSHDPAGKWHPYGRHHHILRTSIDCEGCGLFDCIERKQECILSIGIEPVVAACEEVLTAAGVKVVAAIGDL